MATLRARSKPMTSNWCAPPIHEIAIKHKVDSFGILLTWKSEGMEEHQEIPELAVDITKHLARHSDFSENWLCSKKPLGGFGDDHESVRILACKELLQKAERGLTFTV
eukprot:CAMPEP_0115130968 /NCGR_PEP_ID=MMETSP0227-20121206/52803_1 /TAXON_ID=89957 /ORGANISM="Polarella glacialis, Strain CCMP 1383" /LENGTH=107 /DNA_ID=CAMNT_0002536331 /DNA_START=1098 /DNA_END=1420 /DNA_ORIENTATION=+